MKSLTAFLSIALLGGTVPAAATASDNRYEDVPRVVAVGDVHGRYHELTHLLAKAELVDAELRWDGGPAHLVVSGDMVDRGPDSRRVMDLLMRLESQAAADGGRVHVLMGNHEVMWLTGDHEYTDPADYRAFESEETGDMRDAARERFLALDARQDIEGGFEQRFPPGSLALRAAMRPDGKYGRWLMERPVAVVINDTAYMHAGLSEEFAGASAVELERRVQRELGELLSAWRTLIGAGIVAPEYPMLDAARALASHVKAGAFDDRPRKVMSAAATLSRATGSLLFDPDGPLWYRGNAACNELAESSVVQRALGGLGAGTLVVSHTPSADGRVTSRLDGRLILLDTGERVSALVSGAEGRHVLHADAAGPAAVASDDDHPVANVALSAGEIEEFLREAHVVSMEDVGTGVTNPKRVTLELDGQQMRAVFKAEATPTRSTGRLGGRRLTNISDRHVYELAAYRLDQLLGLDMVPPAVERRIGRETGTLQYWVEDAINERSRRKNDIEPEGACPLAKDYALLELFDRLIYNTDRTQENILYLPDWRVALIDHTRAFRTDTGIPENVRHVSPAEAPGFAERLAGLDRETIERALKDVLDDHQIRAILQRRDEILAEWQGESVEEVAAR